MKFHVISLTRLQVDVYDMNLQLNFVALFLVSQSCFYNQFFHQNPTPRLVCKLFHTTLLLLFKVLLSLCLSVTLLFDHSNESYGEALSCGTVYSAVKEL